MKFFKSIFRGLFIDEISSLKNQIHSMQTDLTERDEIIRQFKNQEQLTYVQITSYSRDIADLQNQVNSCQEAILTKDNAISALNQRISAIVDQLSDAQTENTDLHTRLEEQAQVIAAKDACSRQTETAITAATEQIKKLTSQLSIAEGKIEELTQELNNSLAVISETRQEKSDLLNLLHTKETTLQEVELSVSAVNHEVDRLTIRLSDVNNQLETEISKNQILLAEKEELLSQLNRLQSKNADESVVVALQNDIKLHQTTIKDLESDIQKLNEEISLARDEKEITECNLRSLTQECNHLKDELRLSARRADGINVAEAALARAEKQIAELTKELQRAPTLKDLKDRDKEIKRLKALIGDSGTKVAKEDATGAKTEPQSHNPKYTKPVFPYCRKPATIAPKEAVTIDFPVIENDNVYSQTTRIIDRVFNHRSNSFIDANDIFLHKSAEEISRLRFELEEAARTGIPYLICPCCDNMVKISSRSVGFGSNKRDVQFFSHADRNIACDLKRTKSETLHIGVGEKDENDLSYSYLKQLRRLLANSLRTELSFNKGLSDVEEGLFIESDELPIMKRRLTDVTARFNSINVVFELVTPMTHVARVHDRDIFYLINNRHVFWVFGLESIVDYNELRRSVAKDILFTNKRNVFVFDLEAQEESKRRGELILKCNWLNEDGEWYYQIATNGKNGILVSLDQIHYNQDSCRPYFYDADEPFFLKHPNAERPLNLSREKLKKDIIEAWEYERQRKSAIENLLRENRGVEAYLDDKKWGFKYGNVVFIEPTFDARPVLLGNFAKVEKDGKFGVVNRFGEYSLRVEYERVELLPNGYIIYASEGDWYLFGTIDSLASYDSKDEVNISAISSQDAIYYLTIKKNLFAGQHPEEFYFIGNQIFKKNSNTGKWSLWQSNGAKITDIAWDSFEFTSDDKIKVSLNGRTQLLALDGTVIETQKYKSEKKLSNGYFVVETFDGLWGMTNFSGDDVISPEYDAIISIDEKFLKFQKGNRWGIMSAEGTIISAPVYHSINGYQDGIFNVTKPNEIQGWGYLSGKVDATGAQISDVISQTEDGILITKSFEKYGLEKQGHLLVPHMYDSISYWAKEKYVAQRGTKYGIIDPQNNTLLDFLYSSITPIEKGRSVVYIGHVQQKIDDNLRIIEDVVINLQQGYKKVKLGGKWGILNQEGKIIVDYLYDEILTYRGRIVGIINGRLIKLDAYYPYRLAMHAKNAGIINSRDLVRSGGITFQVLKRRDNPVENQDVSVVLMNWTLNMRYPIVAPYDASKHDARVKLTDRPTDFVIGDKFEAIVKTILKRTGTAKGKFKGVAVDLSNGKHSYIYKRDFEASGIDSSTVIVGDAFTVVKLGYDEELDRTQWKVLKL